MVYFSIINLLLENTFFLCKQCEVECWSWNVIQYFYFVCTFANGIFLFVLFVFSLVAVMGSVPLTATKYWLIYQATLLLTVDLRVSAADKGISGWCRFF